MIRPYELMPKEIERLLSEFQIKSIQIQIKSIQNKEAALYFWFSFYFHYIKVSVGLFLFLFLLRLLQFTGGVYQI